jgi:ATP-dependent Clp protease ATP-binding subunit ClpB
VALLTGELSKRLADRQIKIQISDAARHYIAETGYDPVYGARPLRRFIQRELETRIGRALIAGDVADGATLSVDLKDGELSLRHDP